MRQRRKSGKRRGNGGGGAKAPALAERVEEKLSEGAPASRGALVLCHDGDRHALGWHVQVDGWRGASQSPLPLRNGLCRGPLSWASMDRLLGPNGDSGIGVVC